MKFSLLCAEVPAGVVHGAGDPDIVSIAYDSRQVRPGTLFVAYRGFHTDGHTYIPQALERGAVAIVYEDSAITDQLGDTPGLRVPNARVAMAPLAALLANRPGWQMRTVGITGTDGKTTTTFLTSVALEADGTYSTGFMGTVDFKIGERTWANDTRQSTPEAPEVQAMLREMADAGCTHAILESTSHALSERWNRLGGSGFDVAVLTNVTQEHLDFHGDVGQYRRDKARLFHMLGETADHTDVPAHKRRKIAIVNADDPNHQMFLDAAPATAERYTYGVHSAADVRATAVQASRDGLRFHVSSPWGEADAHLLLTGDFNVHNTLAALTVALAEGVPLDAALAALGQVPGVRGRMERIDAGQPFTVLVDYAHTPGSFEKVFGIIRPLAEQRLIAVFGSAGERDREKRPLQGAIAARHCDMVVITDEDPRLEDRYTILAEIAAGVEQVNRTEGHTCECVQIPDRAAAIRAAVQAARPGDVVLLLGKGHEGSIIYADGKMPWDESAEVRSALAELGFNAA